MRILVLAGGYDSIQFCRLLKQRGHAVFLVDYLEAPMAKKIADKHFRESTLDEAAVYKIAVEQKVDRIISACTDQALLTAAAVSEKMGLPIYLPYRQAIQVTNKKYMKKRFEEIGIPTAKSMTFVSPEEAVRGISNLNFPLVVKPCDCNSSKGVIKVENEFELRQAAQNALKLSRSGTAVMEEYIGGKEISIDVWVDSDGAKVLSVSQSDKIEDGRNNFTIFRSSYPVAVSGQTGKRIRYIAQKIADGFGLRNCPVLIQAIVREEQLYVVEFSARMGGGTKYRLIRHMANVDIMEAFVNRILGDTQQVIVPEPSPKAMELDYVYVKPGIFSSLKNFEKCLTAKEIKEYYVYKSLGTRMEYACTSTDRVAGFLLIEDTAEALQKRRKAVLEKLDVLDEQGNSIMLKEMEGGYR